MKITATKQATWGPSNKPLVSNPVLVTLDVPVYYVSERGPVLSTSPIFCSRLFAETVLRALNDWAKSKGVGLAHVGVYNPRMARHRNGSPILVNGKPRWSNHAKGGGIDWKGIVTDLDQDGDLDYLDINGMQAQAPKGLANALAAVKAALVGKGLRPEIVDEGSWYHLGYYA